MVKKSHTVRLRRYRVDVGYQISFVPPLFQLPSVAAQVIEVFYKHLNPRYPLQMSDLQSLGGASYADVALRFVLFSGAGQLEIKPDRLSGNFQNLQSEADITKIKDCIELGEEALAAAFPNLGISGRGIQLAFWLNCDGGVDAAKKILNERGNAGFPINKEDFEVQELDYTLQADLKSVNEAWYAGFLIQRSALPTADIFFRVTTTYAKNSKYNSLDQLLAHTEDVCERLLVLLGFEPKGDDTNLVPEN